MARLGILKKNRYFEPLGRSKEGIMRPITNLESKLSNARWD